MMMHLDNSRQMVTAIALERKSFCIRICYLIHRLAQVDGYATHFRTCRRCRR